MTITDIAKEEAEKYTNETCKDCCLKSYAECKNSCKKQAFEVAYMLGYNRGRAEEMSKGEYK